MAEGTVAANGITLWYDTFGDPAAVPLLLIVGAGAQAIRWEEPLCARLAAGGHYAIRFDNRDAGLSQWFSDDEPYTLLDMATDAVGLLDALGIARAHLVGASMGGAIAQLVALQHPDRVLSLTLLISFGRNVMDTTLPDAEPLNPTIAALLQRPAPATREERIAHQLRFSQALAGDPSRFDAAETLGWVTRSVDRAWRPEAVVHHGTAVATTPSRLDALRTLAVPALVIHGTVDPLIPVRFAEETAAAIPGSRLVLIEGMGHELPSWAWDQILTPLLEHTAATVSV